MVDGHQAAVGELVAVELVASFLEVVEQECLTIGIPPGHAQVARQIDSQPPTRSRERLPDRRTFVTLQLVVNGQPLIAWQR